jgi:hypothetical protein
MSNYKAGTKLSYNNGTECCTVLTDGNALVTKVWGERWWEQMRLADWLILAEGQEEEDFIPIVPANTLQQEEFDDLPDLISLNDVEVNQFWAELGHRSAQLEAQPNPTYPKRSIGTKLKWVSEEDEETYRVAIVTKHGICQVKAITEGGGDCYYIGKKRYLTKRTFDSEGSWRNALPEGGNVYVY